MESLQILERVKAKFGDRILELSEKKPDPFVVVDPKAIVEIGKFMKEDPEFAMDCLSNETGVDYKDRIEVVYHLFSYQHRHQVVQCHRAGQLVGVDRCLQVGLGSRARAAEPVHGDMPLGTRRHAGQDDFLRDWFFSELL